MRKQYYSGLSNLDDETSPEIHAFSDRLFSEIGGGNYDWEEPVNLSSVSDILRPGASEHWGTCFEAKEYGFRAFDGQLREAGTRFFYETGTGSLKPSHWETFYIKFTPNVPSSHFRLSVFANDFLDVYIFNEAEYNFESMDEDLFDDLVASGTIPVITYDNDNDCDLLDVDIPDNENVSHILHAWFREGTSYNSHPGHSSGVNDYRENYIGSVFISDEEPYTHSSECDNFYDAWIETFDTEIDDFVSRTDWTPGSSFYLLLCPGDYRNSVPEWDHNRGLFAYHLVEYYEPTITVTEPIIGCDGFTTSFNIKDAKDYKWTIYRKQYINHIGTPVSPSAFSPSEVSVDTDEQVLSGTITLNDETFTPDAISIPSNLSSYEFYIVVYDDINGNDSPDNGECTTYERLAIVPTFYVDLDGPSCYCSGDDDITISTNIYRYFLYEEDTYEYTWFFNGTLIVGETGDHLVTTPESSGAWMVTVTDDRSCEYGDYIAIEYNTPIILPDASVCYIPSENLYPLEELTDLTDYIITNISSSTSYTVIEEDIHLGATSTITIDDYPLSTYTELTVTINDADECCPTTEFSIIINPNVEPTWISPSSTTPVSNTCVDF